MTDVVRLIEERRMAVGLTQRSVAKALGVSQPHYSKVIGGVVALTPRLEELMEGWLKKAPVGRQASSRHNERIGKLTRSIERQIRELNELLVSEGFKPARRPTRRTRSRGPGQGT